MRLDANSTTAIGDLPKTAVRSAGRSIGRRGPGGVLHVISRTFQCLLITALSGGLFWLVWIYGNGLRDPRYLDGWVLAAGMGFQLSFHIAVKTTRLSPETAARWRKFHVFVGYLLIAVFISHSDFSLPDTAFEWALWTSFTLVALSGMFGTYLAWSLNAKHGIDDRISYDRIPVRRAELARDVHAVVANIDLGTVDIPLPMPPYDEWVVDLYTTRLQHFFQAQRNFAAHLIGSQRPLKGLTEQIDNLSRYVDQRCQEKLAAIKQLVIEKDRLDFTQVYLGLSKAWLFVHVPVTYSLIVLTVLHVIVVYAFSSGPW
jgi:hypothetical protein